MGTINNRGVSTIVGEPRQIGTLLKYFLMFVPLLAFYPIYYAYAGVKDDVDIEEKMADTPFLEIPGFNSSNSIALPVVALLATVGLFIANSNSLRLLPPRTMLQAVGGILAGIVTTFYLQRNWERKLLLRVGATVFIGIIYGSVLSSVYFYNVGFNLAEYTTALGIMGVMAGATTVGAFSANGYVVKKEAHKQREKKQEGSGDEDTDDHTQTRSHHGDELRDSTGQDILERFSERKWIAPDDLPERGRIQETVHFEPLRDIVRGLWVEESTVKRTIPDTQFREEKSQHRTDYRSRSNVAPDGFLSAEYTFFVPGSKSTSSCDNCGGSAKIDCKNCRSGSVTCSSCSGSGEKRCRKCSGDGRVKIEEDCPACRGSGEKENGFTCNRCSGYGTVEQTRSCSNCRSGTVSCSTCGGGGRVQCSDCGGEGYHVCQKCDGCGKITEFEYVKREYTPDEEVSYRADSVPTGILGNAEGTQVSLENDENPSESGLYRRQDETRQIDVDSVKFEYLGDRWEMFDVEDVPKAVDFPRDYSKQLRLINVGYFVLAPAFVYSITLL